MAFPPQSETIISNLFYLAVGLAILIYLLRGLGILSFIPGGIIWFLILLAIATGILFFVEKSRRF
ncbi:MAG: hypothetical protein J7647_09040 [Cyanobacteria bacterium SBLK]|nr:hypothetical protein [Cyanobacteria bacterium SBLK]